MIARYTKTGKLYGLLSNRILQGEYRPGQKLPSVRQLAMVHGVSTMTAKLAVGELRDGGLVNIRQGSGSYVVDVSTRVAEKNVLQIGLAYLDCFQKCPGSDTVHPAFMQWLRGTQDHFGHRRAMITPFCYRGHSLSAKDSVVRFAVENGQVDGLIITGGVDPRDADYLNENKIPFVLVDNYLPERDVAIIVIDRVYCFKLLYEHLFNLAHRDILFVIYSADLSLRHCSGNPYVRAARSISEESFSSDQIIIVPNDDAGNLPDLGEYIDLAFEKNPTAIIANDAMMAGRIVAEAASRRIEVPGELSIATIVNEFPDAHHMKFTTTNSFASQREMTRVASNLIERAIMGEDIRGKNIVLMPSLIEGKSTVGVSCP